MKGVELYCMPQLDAHPGVIIHCAPHSWLGWMRVIPWSLQGARRREMCIPCTNQHCSRLAGYWHVHHKSTHRAPPC